MDLKRRLRRCPQSDVDWVSCVVTAAAPSSFQLSICQPDSTTSNTAGHKKKVWAFDDVFSVSRFRSRSEIFRFSVIQKLIPTPGEVVRSLIKTRKKRPFLSFIGLFPLWILVCESPTEKTPPPKKFFQV